MEGLGVKSASDSTVFVRKTSRPAKSTSVQHLKQRPNEDGDNVTRIGEGTRRARHWAHIHMILAAEARLARQTLPLPQPSIHSNLVELRLEEGGQYSPFIVSKPLLRVHSLFFRRLLDENPAAVRIELAKGVVAPRGLEMAMIWMESGRVEVGPEELFILGRAGQKLEMTGLLVGIGEELMRVSERGGEEALYCLWLAIALGLSDRVKATLHRRLGQRLADVRDSRQWLALPRLQVQAVLEKGSLRGVPDFAALLHWLKNVDTPRSDKEMFLSRYPRFALSVPPNELIRCQQMAKAEGLAFTPTISVDESTPPIQASPSNGAAPLGQTLDYMMAYPDAVTASLSASIVASNSCLNSSVNSNASSFKRRASRESTGSSYSSSNASSNGSSNASSNPSSPVSSNASSTTKSKTSTGKQSLPSFSNSGVDLSSLKDIRHYPSTSRSGNRSNYSSRHSNK